MFNADYLTPGEIIAISIGGVFAIVLVLIVIHDVLVWATRWRH